MLLPSAFGALRDLPRNTDLFRGSVLDVGESDLLDVPQFVRKKITLKNVMQPYRNHATTLRLIPKKKTVLSLSQQNFTLD